MPRSPTDLEALVHQHAPQIAMTVRSDTSYKS